MKDKTTELPFDSEQLSYTANCNGYMLTYRGKPLGGAGVMLPREKPLHWRHARANVKEFGEQARMSIEELKTGRGESRFLAVIAKIEDETAREVLAEAAR